MKILVILGSVRKGRNGQVVFDWLKKKLIGEEYEFIDLREWNLPFFDNEKSPLQKPQYSGKAKEWQDKIGNADGFILVTCEYNHGYPPALKNALDYLWYEWNDKPVSFVSYGNATGGARAVEQLIQVSIELDMHPLRHQVNIPLIWNYSSPEDLDKEETYGKKLDSLLEQLRGFIERK